MRIFTQISPLRAFLKEQRDNVKSVGLVPTMGALHSGHLELLKASRNENAVTVCSIYVNPAQFNNPSDLEKYPRTLEKDIQILEDAGCDVLFNPDNDEMYPQKSLVTIDFGSLDKVLEGYYRPGHFSGVALVVAKLLHIVQPHRVYFGQKDWQQGVIVKRLVDELKFDVALRRVATARDTDGLALSSRNLRLTAQERKQATIFHEALVFGTNRLRSNGGKFSPVQDDVRKMFDQSSGIRLEYFELVDAENLNAIDRVGKADLPILCIAGYVGDVRLIDNMLVDLSPEKNEN